MIDILKRGTTQVSNFTWEYHGDTDDATMFYITPQPVWVKDDKGLPKIQLVEYNTTDPLNGGGYCTLQVQLSVPDEAIDAVRRDIKQRFGVDNPHFMSLPFQPGTIVNLTYPDGQGGTTGQQVAGSDFGSNAAIFQLSLDAAQMRTFKDVLRSKGGSPFEVQYSIISPARMPSVKLVLGFDSKIALQYQVTSHEHTHWASSSTYTYDISKQLVASNASTITLTKIDPNVPPAVVDNLRTWGQTVLTDMVTKAVEQAIALENNAGGTQSFSVSQISSFTETYEEQQTILWRLQPQAVLPSFADLGLTEEQIQSLEPVVDTRRFIAQITPQCNFVDSEQTLNKQIAPDKDSPYLSNVQKLQYLEVTVYYPTLEGQPTRTFTFRDNQPHTFEADWDERQGGRYSLSYKAVYEQGQSPVTGRVENIDAAQFTITLDLIGILNVTFDASNFFASSKINTVVKNIIVDFVFDIPQRAPVVERFVLDSTNQKKVIQSLSAAPIETNYIYTVTYEFKDTAKANPYTSDAKQQNGQYVYLDQPDLTQAVAVVAKMDNIYQVLVNIYYEGEPYFPAIEASKALPRPTQESPIQLTFPVEPVSADKPHTLLQMQTISIPREQERAAPLAAAGENSDKPVSQQVNLFANSKLSPLKFTGTVITEDFDQYDVGPYLFNPQSVRAFLLSAGKTFAMISVDPTIVVWDKQEGHDVLTSINVRITAVRYTAPPADGSTAAAEAPAADSKVTYDQFIQGQAIVLDAIKKVPYAVHYPVLNLPVRYTGIEFDWEAQYVYKDGAKMVTGTNVQGLHLTLPKDASGGVQPPMPTGVRQWRPSAVEVSSALVGA